MFRSTVSRVSAMLLVALALALAVAPIAPAAPVTWATVDVTVHTSPEGSVLLVSGVLPESAKLPVEAELSVVEGSELIWLGEVLGGPVSEDPKVAYTVAKRGGADVYTFKLSKARTAQLEVNAPEALAANGDAFVGTVKWVPSQDAKSVVLRYRLPAGAQVTTPVDGAEIIGGPDGGSYYEKTFNDVKAGAPLAFTFGFTAPTSAPAAGAPPASSGSGDSGAVVLILLAVIVVFGVVLFGVSRKMRARSTMADEEDDDDIEIPGFEDEAAPVAARPAKKPSAATATPEPEVVPEGMSASRKRTVIIVAGLVVFAVIAGTLATRTSSSVQSVPGGFTREFAQGDPCQSVAFTLKQTPTEKDAAQIMDALQAATVLNATVYADQRLLQVNFCESSTDANRVQAALAPIAIVGPPAAVPGAAPLPTEPATTTP